MYQIVYRSSVKKELRRIPKLELERIIARIMALSDEPRPRAAIQLRGTHNDYRIRQGDYRILYRVEDKIITVTVIKVGHRRDVYNGR